MEPKHYLFVFIGVSLLFAFIYAAYTVPLQAALGALFYFANTRILVALLSYGGVTVAATILTLLAYRARKLLAGAARRVMDYFTLSLAFYTLSVASMTVGLSFFISIGRSFDPASWQGLVYSFCLPMAMMFAGIAPYFMLKFSYWMAEQKEPNIKREALVLLPLIALLILTVFPQNWFGVIDPRISLLDMQLKTYPFGSLDPTLSLGLRVYPDIRFLSNGALLLVNLAAILQITMFLRYRATKETDPVRAARLKTVLLGFLTLLGFFACYTADALVGGPYTMLMFIGFAFLFITPVLMYLGTVAPKRYTVWLEKSTKSS